MSKWLGQLFEKRKQKTRQSWEREVSVEKGLDKEQVIAFVDDLIAHGDVSQKAPLDSIRSLIVRAVTDAEQIAASINKMKAQKEAEEEVIKIIGEARQRADEIRRRTEEAVPSVATSAPPQIEQKPDSASTEQEAKLATKEAAKKKAEEAKQAEKTRKQAEREAKLAAKEETESRTEEAKRAGETQPPVEHKAEPASRESALLEEKIEKPVQLQKDAPVSKTVELRVARPAVPPLAEEKPDRQEPPHIPRELDREAIYDGEVELAIAVPVDPAAVTKLYNYLQTTPDMKILYTRGSWDRGTTITVTLDKPLPLIGMISKIAGLKIAPGLPQKNNLVKGTSGSMLGAKRKEATRIDLVLETE